MPLTKFREPGSARLIDVFTRKRLLIQDRQPGPDGGIQVRVAHDALLNHWDRAKKIIDGFLPDKQLYERLHLQAAEWKCAPGDQAQGYLLPAGPLLERAEDLLARMRPLVDADVVQWIAAPSRAEQKRRKDEQARRQAEQEAKLHEQRRRARNARRLAFVMAVLASCAGGAGFLAWQSKIEAQSNFDKAHQAVDESFTLVSQSTLLNKPGLEPLREQLLEKALKYYEDLSKQRARDSEMRETLADAAFNVGSIKQLLGDHAGSAEAYGRAIELFEALVREHPEVLQYGVELARSHNNLGVLQSAGGDAAGARESNQKAIEIQEILAREHPEVLHYRSELAGSHYNLGNLQSDGDDAAGARASRDARISKRSGEVLWQLGLAGTPRQTPARSPRMGEPRVRTRSEPNLDRNQPRTCAALRWPICKSLEPVHQKPRCETVEPKQQNLRRSRAG
ncbi:MAG: hypothetical protein ACRER2_03255 [Methylococcales bacterium]